MLLVSGLRIVPLFVVAIRDSDGPFLLLPQRSIYAVRIIYTLHTRNG